MRFNYLIICLIILVWISNQKQQLRLTSNFNLQKVSEYSLLGQPLDVPFTHQLSNQLIHPTPITEKYSIGKYQSKIVALDRNKLENKMTQLDYEMIYVNQPPPVIFQDHYNKEYHLLENREFYVIMANPSQVFNICVHQIFTDSQSIKKALKKQLPFCLNSHTKFPFHFNLYVTFFKNRQILKAGIYFNISIMDQKKQVINKIWMKQVTFQLLNNHLKLSPFELKNCKKQNSLIVIKNPQKYDLSLLIIYKYKKYHINGQTMQDKFVVISQKTFKFMIQGKDSTMTIITKTVESTDKIYPMLYVPISCLDQLIIENAMIGIISDKRVSLQYPIYLTSNSNQIITVESIELNATSEAAYLNKHLNSSKNIVQPNQKLAHIANFVVHPSQQRKHKNIITLRLKYSYLNLNNQTQKQQISKSFTYIEMQSPIEVSQHRFYDVTKLAQQELNETEKIRNYNYSMKNMLQIPIRLERVNFNPQKFRMNWFRYNGRYIYPDSAKQQILLEYIGPRQLPISPLKFIINFQFNGGISIPIQASVYDNTLICNYMNKQSKCSNLKYINFGYLKHEERIQTQMIQIKNLNPFMTNLGVQTLENIKSKFGISVYFKFSEQFPYNPQPLNFTQNGIFYIKIKSGHSINVTIGLNIYSNATSGEIPLNLFTPFERLSPKIKFNFDMGKMLLYPETYIIPQNDKPQNGQLTFISTFQQSYRIKQIIFNTSCFQFMYNRSQQYQQNAKVMIYFVYNPHKYQHNLTDQCCNQYYLKNYYQSLLPNYQNYQNQKYQIKILTTTGLEKKFEIKIDTFKDRLIYNQVKNQNQIILKVIKIKNISKFHINMRNPYNQTLKYNIFMLSEAFTHKPNDFVNYHKYTKKEKVNGIFCFNPKGKNINYLTYNTLKQIFRLEEKPIQIQIIRNIQGNFRYSSNSQIQISEYLRSIVKTGYQLCYSININLYTKLLIQTQILNYIIDNYNIEILQKFMIRQFENLIEFGNVLSFDEFYYELKINVTKYCNSIFYPIFKFCNYIPIEFNQMDTYKTETKLIENKANKHHHLITYLLQPLQHVNLSFHVYEPHSLKQIRFQLIIANNFSKYDNYIIDVQLIDLKIKIGDIAFEENHNVNSQNFVKNYFPILHRYLTSEKEENKSKYLNIDKNKIVPIYLTNQDYQESFNTFRGQRYFEIINQASIDLVFTHMGFEKYENVTHYKGMHMELVDRSKKINSNNVMYPQKQKQLIFHKFSKTTIKLSFNIDSNLSFNISNTLFHQNIRVYFYYRDQYYLKLNLIVKIADNVVNKLKKIQTDQYEFQASNLKYMGINVLSFAYVCLVIMKFKKEEKIKDENIKSALEKKEKIDEKHQYKRDNMDIVEDLVKTNHTHFMTPEAIGVKIIGQYINKYKLVHTISEENLQFFKSLKPKQEKSFFNDSQQSYLGFRLSHQQDKKVIQHQLSSQDRDQDSSRQQKSEVNSNIVGNGISSDQSFQSLSEQSNLTQGISVSNEQLIDIDGNTDFQFGFESANFSKKIEGEAKAKDDQMFYYNVFSSSNPLKKDKDKLPKENPFPWIQQKVQKKKSRGNKKTENK